MRHIRIKNNSVPILGTSRYRGMPVLPDKHGIVRKHKGKGVQMMLSEPELSQHGLSNITDGMENVGMGMKKKKHLKPLHFRM